MDTQKTTHDTRNSKQGKQRAPGQSHREGIGFLKAAEMFATEEKAERWFADQRWPEGVVHCPRCDGTNIRTRTGEHPRRGRYRCRPCQYDFSVKTGSVMHDSKLGYRHWAIAVYQVTTGIKGTSSMKLHRDLEITQKSAWFLGHRIRNAMPLSQHRFIGEVEVDETFIGGVEGNKHADKKLHERWMDGKQTVVGIKNRESGMIMAEVTERRDKAALQGFVLSHSEPSARVYTDEAPAYKGMPRFHESVNHKVGEYVRGQVHTNGMESFWSLLKRGLDGTYHKISPKHLHRYVNEFVGRHNLRPSDTLDQMGAIVLSMEGKRLTYENLTSEPPTS